MSRQGHGDALHSHPDPSTMHLSPYSSSGYSSHGGIMSAIVRYLENGALLSSFEGAFNLYNRGTDGLVAIVESLGLTNIVVDDGEHDVVSQTEDTVRSDVSGLDSTSGGFRSVKGGTGIDPDPDPGSRSDNGGKGSTRFSNQAEVDAASVGSLFVGGGGLGGSSGDDGGNGSSSSSSLSSSSFSFLPSLFPPGVPDYYARMMALELAGFAIVALVAYNMGARSAASREKARARRRRGRSASSSSSLVRRQKKHGDRSGATTNATGKGGKKLRKKMGMLGRRRVRSGGVAGGVNAVSSADDGDEDELSGDKTKKKQRQKRMRRMSATLHETWQGTLHGGLGMLKSDNGEDGELELSPAPSSGADPDTETEGGEAEREMVETGGEEQEAEQVREVDRGDRLYDHRNGRSFQEDDHEDDGEEEFYSEMHDHELLTGSDENVTAMSRALVFGGGGELSSGDTNNVTVDGRINGNRAADDEGNAYVDGQVHSNNTDDDDGEIPYPALGGTATAMKVAPCRLMGPGVASVKFLVSTPPPQTPAIFAPTGYRSIHRLLEINFQNLTYTMHTPRLVHKVREESGSGNEKGGGKHAKEKKKPGFDTAGVPSGGPDGNDVDAKFHADTTGQQPPLVGGAAAGVGSGGNVSPGSNNGINVADGEGGGIDGVGGGNNRANGANSPVWAGLGGTKHDPGRGLGGGGGLFALSSDDSRRPPEQQFVPGTPIPIECITNVHGEEPTEGGVLKVTIRVPRNTELGNLPPPGADSTHGVSPNEKKKMLSSDPVTRRSREDERDVVNPPYDVLPPLKNNDGGGADMASRMLLATGSGYEVPTVMSGGRDLSAEVAVTGFSPPKTDRVVGDDDYEASAAGVAGREGKWRYKGSAETTLEFTFQSSRDAALFQALVLNLNLVGKQLRNMFVALETVRKWRCLAGQEHIFGENGDIRNDDEEEKEEQKKGEGIEGTFSAEGMETSRFSTADPTLLLALQSKAPRRKYPPWGVALDDVYRSLNELPYLAPRIQSWYEAHYPSCRSDFDMDGGYIYDTMLGGGGNGGGSVDGNGSARDDSNGAHRTFIHNNNMFATCAAGEDIPLQQQSLHRSIVGFGDFIFLFLGELSQDARPLGTPNGLPSGVGIHRLRSKGAVLLRKRVARAALYVRSYVRALRVVCAGWKHDAPLFSATTSKTLVPGVVNNTSTTAPTVKGDKRANAVLTYRLPYDDDLENINHDRKCSNEYYEGTVGRDVRCDVHSSEHVTKNGSSVESKMQGFALVGCHVFARPQNTNSEDIDITESDRHGSRSERSGSGNGTDSGNNSGIGKVDGDVKNESDGNVDNNDNGIKPSLHTQDGNCDGDTAAARPTTKTNVILSPEQDPVLSIDSLHRLIMSNPMSQFFVMSFFPEQRRVAVILLFVRTLPLGVDKAFDTNCERFERDDAYPADSTTRNRKLEVFVQLGPSPGLSPLAWGALKAVSAILAWTRRGEAAIPVKSHVGGTERTPFPGMTMSSYLKTRHFGPNRAAATMSSSALPMARTLLPTNYVAVTAHIDGETMSNYPIKLLYNRLEDGALNASVVDFTFVLEGEKADELPERALASVRLCKVDAVAVALAPPRPPNLESDETVTMGKKKAVGMRKERRERDSFSTVSRSNTMDVMSTEEKKGDPIPNSSLSSSLRRSESRVQKTTMDDSCDTGGRGAQDKESVSRNPNQGDRDGGNELSRSLSATRTFFFSTRLMKSTHNLSSETSKRQEREGYSECDGNSTARPTPSEVVQIEAAVRGAASPSARDSYYSSCVEAPREDEADREKMTGTAFSATAALPTSSIRSFSPHLHETISSDAFQPNDASGTFPAGAVTGPKSNFHRFHILTKDELNVQIRRQAEKGQKLLEKAKTKRAKAIVMEQLMFKRRFELEALLDILDGVTVPVRRPGVSDYSDRSSNADGVSPRNHTSSFSSNHMLQESQTEETEQTSTKHHHEEQIPPDREGDNSTMVKVPVLDNMTGHDLFRFLVASDHDLPTAAVRIVESAAWRGITFPVDTRLCRVELQTGQFFQQGIDKLGRPVFYFRRLCRGPWRRDVDASVLAILHRLESALLKISAQNPAVRCTLVIITCKENEKNKKKTQHRYDKVPEGEGDDEDGSPDSGKDEVSVSSEQEQTTENIRVGQRSAPVDGDPRVDTNEEYHEHTNNILHRMLLQVLSRHYPERLAKALVVPKNALGITWGGLRAHIASPKTRSRVELLGSMDELKHYIDEKELITLCGGKATVKLSAYTNH